jgi:hypothetical protein
MPLRVIALARYFANRGIRWRPEDFDSYKWVQALKGKPLNGYAYVPVGGTRKRLSDQNLASAVEWFATLAVQECARRGLAEPFTIIPVPNSNCTISSSAPARTRRLARAVAQELNDTSVVVDCLRWKRNLGSASEEGGPRDPKILYDNVTILKELLKDVDKSRAVLLTDDVITSGGHLRACAARLRGLGFPVGTAVCGGKTLYDQDKHAFTIFEETFDDFEP